MISLGKPDLLYVFNPPENMEITCRGSTSGFLTPLGLSILKMCNFRQRSYNRIAN